MSAEDIEEFLSNHGISNIPEHLDHGFNQQTETDNETPITKKLLKWPHNADPPIVDVKRTTSGFFTLFIVDLAALGHEQVKAGDKIYLQVVRNYRGQSGSGSVLLQLFPNYIYGDK